jgi:hypothetical protein
MDPQRTRRREASALQGLPRGAYRGLEPPTFCPVGLQVVSLGTSGKS